MENKFNDTIFRVRASELSVNDAFMQNLPKTKAEKDLMIKLVTLITREPKDFCCFVYGPISSAIGVVLGDTIIPESIDGISYYDWENIAGRVEPGRHSRIGTEKEYILLLGILIKGLVKLGWKVDEAWDIVCNNSEKILDSRLESEEITILKNLVKTEKILSAAYYENHDVAFLYVGNSCDLSRLCGVAYNSKFTTDDLSEFQDWIRPYPPDSYTLWVDELVSEEPPDVKAEKRKEIAWIVMDAD